MVGMFPMPYNSYQILENLSINVCRIDIRDLIMGRVEEQADTKSGVVLSKEGKWSFGIEGPVSFYPVSAGLSQAMSRVKCNSNDSNDSVLQSCAEPLHEIHKRTTSRTFMVIFSCVCYLYVCNICGVGHDKVCLNE
jgi:hypothetical protein